MSILKRLIVIIKINLYIILLLLLLLFFFFFKKKIQILYNLKNKINN